MDSDCPPGRYCEAEVCKFDCTYDADCRDEDLGPLGCPLTFGVCAAAQSLCLGVDGWSVCDYGADHESDDETRCDGLDNDCDGQIDEGLTPDYSVCEIGPLSADGIDNNCDGLTDEPGGCIAQLPGRQVWIDVYEVSLYENQYCSGAVFGQVADDYPFWFPDVGNPSQNLYACSIGDVRPSRYLTRFQAHWACEAIGKRLCTREEWTYACADVPASEQVYPYGDTFEPGLCNDFTNPADDSSSAGAFPECVSWLGLFDMSGNVWEWVADACSWDAAKSTLQGGTWTCDVDGLDCEVGNPDHEDIYNSRMSCQHRSDNWWCVDPDTSARTYGARCCWDGP